MLAAAGANRAMLAVARHRSGSKAAHASAWGLPPDQPAVTK